MATVVVRLLSSRDLDKLLKIVAANRASVAQTSAGYRGVFVRLVLPDDTDALGTDADLSIESDQ